MKPKEKPTTNEMLPENASQRAQERAEELRNDGQHVLIIGETQVVYCSSGDVDRYREQYRIFNRDPQDRALQKRGH